MTTNGGPEVTFKRYHYPLHVPRNEIVERHLRSLKQQARCGTVRPQARPHGSSMLGSRPDVQQNAAGGSAADNIERLVDVVERKLVRNDALERDAAGRGQPEDAGDVDVG